MSPIDGAIFDEDSFSCDDGFVVPAKTVKPATRDERPVEIISGPLFFASPAIASPSEEPMARRRVRFNDAIDTGRFEVEPNTRMNTVVSNKRAEVPIHAHRQWDGLSKAEADNWK